MTLNRELLLQVRGHILAEPESLDMDTVVEQWACGTVACIAGWTLLLAGVSPAEIHSKDWDEISAEAMCALGVRGASEGIFYVDCWPDDLRGRYDRSTKPATRAGLAAERIDRFIAEYAGGAA